MKLDENYKLSGSFADCMTARSQLRNGCLAGDQNLPRIKFLSKVKNSLVGNKNVVFIS